MLKGAKGIFTLFFSPLILIILTIPAKVKNIHREYTFSPLIFSPLIMWINNFGRHEGETEEK